MSVSFSSAAGAATSYGVISQTLDTMNHAGSSPSSDFALNDKQSVGAAVVSKTLDYMNAGSGSSASKDMSQTYQFSKDVLGAYTSGVGSLADANA